MLVKATVQAKTGTKGNNYQHGSDVTSTMTFNPWAAQEMREMTNDSNMKLCNLKISKAIRPWKNLPNMRVNLTDTLRGKASKPHLLGDGKDQSPTLGRGGELDKGIRDPAREWRRKGSEPHLGGEKEKNQRPTW